MFFYQTTPLTKTLQNNFNLFKTDSIGNKLGIYFFLLNLYPAYYNNP